MAEALKNFFDAGLIASIAAELGRVYPALDRKRFVADGLDGLAALELLARGEHLARVLHRHLPSDYERAVRVIVDSLPERAPSEGMAGMAPFRYLPHVCFVARFGIEHFEASMHAQYELTQRFSAESSIRPFLVRYPEATYQRLVSWASDESAHVRRLVSEGTRPRLPWAPRLREFQREPGPVLALLERLKDDPERYVQRSVANNLNDIAKDHADRVVELCRRWQESAGEGRRWIIRHALRSLVKRAHPGALAVVGAGGPPKVNVGAVEVAPARPRLGKQAAVSFELTSTGPVAQELLVDYAVHFVKANGARRPKVFKLRRLKLPARGSVRLQAKVSFADLTTRKHYRGVHAVELLVNGVRFELCEFEVA